MRSLVLVGLGAAALASCGVDQAGLGSMPFLPHDASAGGVTGSAGASGATGGDATGGGGTGGSNVTGLGGTTATAGTGGGAIAGMTGAAGTIGSAGTTGEAGTTGAAGTGGGAGTIGAAGTGVAGTMGAAGTGGSAGTTGSAGATGVGGLIGTAGTTGVAGTTGMAGAGGIGGRGGAGGTAGGNGGRGGTGVIIPCTPTNCADGCCSNNMCIRNRTAFLCGAQGASCSPCGGCQTCSSTGQCRIDPTSRWTIKAVSAQLSGTGWDRPAGEVGGAAPDPFCEFENPAGQVTTTTAGTTDTITDTAKPTWNQVITPVGMTVAASTLMSANPTWQIWVGDDDGCSPQGTNCSADVACTIRQQISESTLRIGELVVTNRQSCAQVTLDFMCQPAAASTP